MDIRCGLTTSGDIEAAVRSHGPVIRNVIIDSRFGNVIGGSVKYGDELFRPLVRAAREAIRLR